MNDLLGGQVDIMCDQTTNTTGQIEAGKVKAYAVTTTKRPPRPHWPSCRRWTNRASRASTSDLARPPCAQGTPKAVVDKVNAAPKVALQDADFHKRQEAPAPSS